MRVSLDHVHIFASDVSATVRFFSQMFGASCVWDDEAAGVRNVRLAIGNSFLHLYDQPPKGMRGGAMHHIGIETDDLEGLVARMASQGYAFRNEIRRTPNYSYVMVSAPDDLLIELFETREPQRWGIRTE